MCPRADDRVRQRSDRGPRASANHAGVPAGLVGGRARVHRGGHLPRACAIHRAATASRDEHQPRRCARTSGRGDDADGWPCRAAAATRTRQTSAARSACSRAASRHAPLPQAGCGAAAPSTPGATRACVRGTAARGQHACGDRRAGPGLRALDRRQRRAGHGARSDELLLPRVSGTVARRILRDGTIDMVSIFTSSGDQTHDAAAARAIARVQRVPPLPAAFPESSLALRMRFEN
jgi:TonB family protein